MSLDLERLENVVISNGKLTARCPACAENGEDSSGDHLFIENEGPGRFGCVVYAGSTGVEHRKRIWALAGVPGDNTSFPAVPHRTCTRASSPKAKPPFPILRQPTDEILEAIRDLREWPAAVGLELLAARGLLWDGDVYDGGAEWPAWIITDSSRKNAQARTFDGNPWMGIGGKKAKSLPGSKASWPIGAADIGDRPFVILCEGQPDFCAALLVVWFENKELVECVAPVCMTGAGNSIHPDALPNFVGKHIRIATHNDLEGQGQEAARRWATQLVTVAAAKVEVIDFGKTGLTKFDGSPIKDLADYATLLNVENYPHVELFADWLDLIRT